MRSCFKKIIAVFATFAIVASLSFSPVFATEYEARPTSWWDSAVMKAISTDTDIPLFDYLLVTAGDVASGTVCAGSSPDKLHHGSVTAEGERGGVDKAGQPYVWVKCKYCGDMFKGYASDLSAAYDDYVQTLPAPGYNSAGRIIWQPTSADISEIFLNGSSYSGFTFDNLPEGCSVSYSTSGFVLSLDCESVKTPKNFFVYASFKNVPVVGSYGLIKDIYGSANVCNRSGVISTIEGSSGNINTGFLHYNLDDIIARREIVAFPIATEQYLSCVVKITFPCFQVIPDASLSGDTYNINTRPTSITGGNYGIVGDNGQITKVEDNSTIINETNNTYYNPATGQTVPITGWSYDYSDRSYKVTLESGDTVTVTYGDENIVIKEGDTIYNVYYLIDGTGSGEVCAHDWQESSSTDPTCTLPGKVTLTCTKCQQTKTESIPALGHNWQVKQTVTTQYDEEGNLTQQGYTIFECSRCHEQYKSTDGTAPPGGGSGTDPGEEDDGTTIGGLIEKLLSGLGGIVGGIIKGLLSLLTKAVEALAGLAELFTTFVGSLVELWGGFTSFLSAVFPFLPEEFVVIIELGLVLMIAAAVFRKFIS